MTYPINQQVNPYKQHQQPVMGLNVNNENNSQSFEKVNVNPEQIKDNALNKTKKTWLGRVSEGLAAQNLTIGKAIICALGAVGVVFGASGAMNHFIRNGGMFKMGTFFDKLSARIFKNKTASSIADKCSKGMKSLTTWFKKTDLGKLYSNKKNLLNPKNMWAAFMSRGTQGEAVDEVTDTLQAIIKEGRDQPKEYNGLLGNFRKR